MSKRKINIISGRDTHYTEGNSTTTIKESDNIAVLKSITKEPNKITISTQGMIILAVLILLIIVIVLHVSGYSVPGISIAIDWIGLDISIGSANKE
jgi:hypothetical protein